MRRILDVIRGRSYEEALVIAEYLPYKACETILKVLMSVSMGGCQWVLHVGLACMAMATGLEPPPAA